MVKFLLKNSERLLVQKLFQVHSPVIVSALASYDIYTEGPVDIRFVLEE